MSEPPLIRYRSMVYDSARWEGFRLRPDDIIVTTPPKCGTTWTQMICALLVLQTTPLPAPLTTISPWLDMRTRPLPEVVAALEAQQHRRIIKTHTPHHGLPWDDHVTYVCVARDPRDVALSFANHQDNLDLVAVQAAIEASAAIEGSSAVTAEQLPPPASLTPPPEATLADRFWLWVDDPTPPTLIGSSLVRTVEHLASFWEVRDRPNVVLLHYDDLQADLEGQMRALAGRLGIDVPDERWDALVDAATFTRMREQASTLAPGSAEGHWRDDRRFFRQGTSGQWQDVLDEDGRRRYDETLARLASPDLIAWLEREAAPATDLGSPFSPHG